MSVPTHLYDTCQAVFWTECGGELTDQYGSINSPGYPGQYPHSRDCVWTVAAPLGRRLQFQFAVLRLEHHDNCSYDSLEVGLLKIYCNIINQNIPKYT